MCSQEAVAICFETEQQRIDSADCYFNTVCEELRLKRDKMARFLEEVGVVPTVPEGGYYMIADFSNLSKSATNLIRSQAVARIADPTASQQTLVLAISASQLLRSKRIAVLGSRV